MSLLTMRLVCTLAFLLGVGVDVMIRADHAKRSDVNTHPTRWSFIVDNVVVLLARLFWSSIAFGIWLFRPDWLSIGLTWLNVPAKYANWITITPNPATAAGGGALIDYGLDWAQAVVAKKNIPVLTSLLKAKLPQYDESVVNVKKIEQMKATNEKPSNEPEF